MFKESIFILFKKFWSDTPANMLDVQMFSAMGFSVMCMWVRLHVFHIVCSLRTTHIVPVLVLHHVAWRCQQHNWFVICCTASAPCWPDTLLFPAYTSFLLFSPLLCLSLPLLFLLTTYSSCPLLCSPSLFLSLEILSLLGVLTWIALPPGLLQAPFIMMLQFNVKFILLFAVALPCLLCLYTTFGFSLRAPVDSVTLATFLFFSLSAPRPTRILCEPVFEFELKMLICWSALLPPEYAGGPRGVKMCTNYSPNEFCTHASLREWNFILHFSKLI